MAHAPRSHPRYREENQRLIRELVRTGVLTAQDLPDLIPSSNDPRGIPLSPMLLDRGILTLERLEYLYQGIATKLVWCAACQAPHPSNTPFSPGPFPECGGKTGLQEIENTHASLAAPASRFELGDELGVGGLGRVLLGRDRHLGREVAVKIMRDPDRSPASVERFLREARVAGRLMHPNIVPVFELGVRPGPNGEAPYFVMGRIEGRDLGDILHALDSGDAAAIEAFPLSRLLRVFQEACRAVAYAHDRSVIHRDIKPDNIMVGAMGEVYVVDWGLAKVRRSADPGNADHTDPEDTDPMDADRPSVRKSPELFSKDKLENRNLDPGTFPSQTLEGDILGTPAYMPPEQASGKVDEIDETSDIYSLGAVLYEILTYRPPFDASSLEAAIGSILHGDLVPPSIRASQVRTTRQSMAGRSATGGESAGTVEAGAPAPRVFVDLPAPVPDPLEEIVVKAMAPRKKDRYASAMDLHREVQDYLDGEKERARNRERALAKVDEGRAIVDRLARLREQLELATEQVAEVARRTPVHWPVDKRKDLWDLEERVASLQDSIVDAFTEAGSAFLSALEIERGNAEARHALAGLYWDQFLREDAAGNRTDARRYERLVRQYNDGAFDAALKGDGMLSVATRIYPCTCLTQGRSVDPEAFDLRGYNPFSGRALDGRAGARGLVDVEPSGPIHLNTHGPDCRTEKAGGAHVWLFKHELVNRVLLPVRPCVEAPTGADPEHAAPVFREAVDILYSGGSPYRPREGLYLGATPIPEFSLPMGSYLLIVASPGMLPVRCPVHVARQARIDLSLTLHAPGELPSGFVQVPEGAFTYQGDADNPSSGEGQVVHVEDVFISRYPVCCREYAEFLNDPAVPEPERLARAPREAPKAGFYWPRDGHGRIHVPTASWLARAPRELRSRARRLAGVSFDWEESWPLQGVSWSDLVAYAAWRSNRDGRLFSLPHEVHWEKAARGPDGRFQPWGDFLEGTFCNWNQTHPDGARPCPVDRFPVDESPYGVRGMGGNARDWCLNDPEVKARDWRIVRGGFWNTGGYVIRSSGRSGGPENQVSGAASTHLVCMPRCRVW